jgi:hypothetical protein
MPCAVHSQVTQRRARGVPVVATPQAAAGLEAKEGRELLVAEDGEGFAAALARLAAEPRLASELTAAGRSLLAARRPPGLPCLPTLSPRGIGSWRWRRSDLLRRLAAELLVSI